MPASDTVLVLNSSLPDVCANQCKDPGQAARGIHHSGKLRVGKQRKMSAGFRFDCCMNANKLRSCRLDVYALLPV